MNGIDDDKHYNEKNRIIKTATKLIDLHGLAQFKIDTLSEHLGYSRQNIYRYYPSKKAILNAVIIEGSRTLATAISSKLNNEDKPFDEQLIEGILIACDLLRDEKILGSYMGKNASQSFKLFMENAGEIQQALLVFLEPIYEDAKKKGELYLSMSFEDITKWLFHVVVSEIALTSYESRASRKIFLLKMFSPSINAKKARTIATSDDINGRHLRR
jgi:AcrR family transcriptional regulator